MSVHQGLQKEEARPTYMASTICTNFDPLLIIEVKLVWAIIKVTYEFTKFVRLKFLINNNFPKFIFFNPYQIRSTRGQGVTDGASACGVCAPGLIDAMSKCFFLTGGWKEKEPLMKQFHDMASRTRKENSILSLATNGVNIEEVQGMGIV